MVSSMTLSSKSPVRNPQRPPSTSIKDRVFLIVLECNKFCTKVTNHVPSTIMRSCLWSGTINVLQVTEDDMGVLDTLLIMLEFWNFAHRSEIQCQEQLLGQEWPMSSMLPVRNPQCPPSQWWWWVGSWHTSNLARKLKFGTHVRIHTLRTFKMPRMNRVIHVSSEEPSKSSKSLKMTGGSWHL